MPSPSRSTRRPKLRLRPGGLLLLVALLLAAALPLIASAELQSGTTPAHKALGVVAAIIRGRAPSRFDTSSRKPASSSRGNVTPQALGCANATTPINYGQTISGADIKLAPGDCTNPIDGTLYDAYTFDGVAGQQLVIDMTSTDFDDYLYLMRPGETTLDPATTIQDDDSGGGTNARLTLTLPSSGTYTILADSYYNGITPGGTGPYALTVTQVCTYALPNASRAVGSHGGSFSDAYTTQAGCPAPALTSNNAFITAGSATAPDASGSSTFGYTVAANTGAARAGTLTVADQTFTVQQAAFLPGTLQLSSSTYNVGEGAGSVSINVTRTGGSDGAVSVNYATANDVGGAHPATGGSDYTSQSGTLNFAEGETLKTISIQITDDAEVEGDETFIVSLSNVAGGATLGSPGSASVTITDNDTCSYSINPTSHTSPAAGDSGSVSVTAPVGCSWTAASNANWITITSGASGSASGTVGYTVAANPNSATRTAALTIAGQTFNVTQGGVSCAFTLSSAGPPFTPDGGTGSVVVTANAPDCAWSATSNNSWITINSGASGTGNGTVGFNVGAHTSSIARTGTLTIAGQTFTVTQSGVSCAYTITPTSQSFASSGGTNNNVSVTTNASDCSWTAASNDNWITINSGATGSGNGPVNYSVAPNIGAARTGTLTVAGQTFTVTQAAGHGVLQFSSSAYAISEGGGNVVLTVTRTVAAGGAVSVNYATSNGTATGGVGADYGTQTGTLNFADGVTSQTITIPILEDQIVEGDETFTVTLSNATGGATLGSPATATVTISDDDTCSYTLSNASRAVGSSGGTFSDAYKTLVGCAAPTVTSNNTAFITAGAASAPDANGNGTFAYTVAPNTGSQRTGTLTIAGQTFTVTQAFATYQISGHITDSGSNDLSGVTVTLSGSSNASTTTDAQGHYSFANVAAGGDYIVTPSQTNYHFDPVSASFNLLGDKTANFVGTPGSVTLAGRVTVGMSGLSGVTINLSGTTSGPAQTDEQGNYTFSVAGGGNYTVTPSLTHYTFSPPSQGFDNLVLDHTAVDFAATLNTHAISGHITDGAGTPLIGVNVNLSGTLTTATTTNASGDYSFLNLPAGGTYTVTPALANYTFTPSSRTFTDLGSDQTTANFNDTLNNYTISGHVTLGSSALSGVTVTISNATTGLPITTMQTVADGNYSFTVPAAGNYTVTPTKQNYTFTPASQQFTNLSANQTANFSAALVNYTISGQVMGDGKGIPDLNVTLSGDALATTSTDAQGNFSFSVTAEHNYTIKPSDTALYAFAVQNVTNISANQQLTFTGALRAYTISGRVTNGGAALTVVLSGDQSALTTTDAQGNYSFANLTAGKNYTVTPSRANYTFAPQSATFNNLLSDQTANFNASLNSYTISGQVLADGVGLAGATVSLTGAQIDPATTDVQGNYSFANVPGGASVTLTPAKANYTFTPAQQTINIDGDRPHIDFVGTVVPSVLQFAQGQYQIAEDGGRVNINITRTGNPSAAVSVEVRTVDNPAAVPCGDTTTLPNVAFARCDYSTTVETLVFAANETQKTVSVPIIDDSWVEPVETFQLALSNPTGGATIGAQGTTSVAITDNDMAGEPNPINSTDFFVRQQYLDFLSREPETGQPWSGVLNNCAAGDTSCDRISVSANFFRSQEFQLKGLFVFHFYRLAFNRLPFYSEIVADMRAVTGTTTAEVQAKKGAFTNAFTQRQEFKNLYDALTNQQFVDALMDRYSLQSITTPDPSAPDGTTKVTLTRADLFNRLNAATFTRAQVVRAIADSDQVGAIEFNPAFVAMQYFGYLRRDPETGGYNAWLQTINANPADFRSMVNGFMNSQEYRARFGQP